MSVKLACGVGFSLALLLCIIQLATAKAPIAMPNCEDRCGDIEIPFPFGMDSKDCYFDEWFEIKCNQSRAFLNKINMELLNIYIRGKAHVKSPIMLSNCSGMETDHLLPLNLTGSPFSISDYNVFTAVGCDTRALMIDNPLQRLGCESKCLGQKDVDWRQLLPNLIKEREFSSGKYYSIADDYCNGTDCCQITIPSSLQVFNASFEAIDGNRGTRGCKLAFLAGLYAGDSWTKNDSNVQFPMVLDWMIKSNRTESSNWMIDSGLWNANYSETVDCYNYYGSSSASSKPVFGCECSYGYEGNPYINCTDLFIKGLTLMVLPLEV
ncbi:wall-associated receptor kinase-like 22 [Manihot esculenta]|uniref:wall-associated receptor kinase-like 22 n=1 Tax=Manihot esculenta TaxID=3983 RepID=UPI000B5D0D96|nr:wall-associated receptor kinase-like 22 [Manihot esculenta]